MEEAIEVGKMLNARYTILTHFSQRYPKNVNHDQGARSDEISAVTLQERAGSYKTFVCAHDLMKIKFEYLDAICQLRDDLEACFVDEDDYCCLFKNESFNLPGRFNFTCVWLLFVLFSFLVFYLMSSENIFSQIRESSDVGVF